MKGKQVLSKLKRAGVEVLARRGKKHYKLRHRDKFTTFPRSPSDYGPVYLKMICKQLNLDYDEVFKRGGKK